MKVAALIDSFINLERFKNSKELRRTRLFVRACLLTSLFSNSYVWLSVIFGYEKGVYLMLINVIGFLLLPFLAKSKLPIIWLGNMYVFLGAFAVITLTYFSGGIWSAIYPWIISIPVLALLVVNKFSGAFWGAVSFGFMLWFGALALKDTALPIEYDLNLKTEWFVTVVPGLLLIILFISFIFEATQSKALTDLEQKNGLLVSQKKTIEDQSTKLEKLIEEKDHIIRMLSHDLRNPLKNISSLASLMDIEDDATRKKEIITRISHASKSANNLVSRVLEMDASNQEDVKIQLESIDVNKLLEEIIKNMNEGALKKDIQLILNRTEENTFIKADKMYSNLIFENLISNAVKFSEKSKKVNINISKKQKSVIIKIIDEGQGIDPTEQDKLFKKFTKLSSKPTAGESSTGLGLSLVKRYVELSGGKVWYEENKGEGATFLVEMSLET